MCIRDSHPGALAGVLELADLAVGDQVGRGAAALVEEGEGAVTIDLLVAQAGEVAAQGVGEQRAPGLVVDLAGAAVAGTPVAGAAVTLGATGRAAVLAVGTAVEVAQVGLQRTRADGPVEMCIRDRAAVPG